MCVPAHMNLPELAHAHADLSRAAARGRAADEVRRADRSSACRKELVGAAIFALASLTDWLDGYLARRRKQVTPLGQVIDPLADKLLTSAAFISLVQMGLAPAWMVAIIIGREFAVTGLRSLAYSRGVAMPASPLGKIKMVGAGRGDPGADPRRRHWPDLLVIGQAALWVVVVTALVSAVDYFRRFNRMLNRRVAVGPRDHRGRA